MNALSKLFYLMGMSFQPHHKQMVEHSHHRFRSFCQLNVVQRTISAIILAPLVTIFLWHSPAFATASVCSFLTSICSYEFAWLAHRIQTRVWTRLRMFEDDHASDSTSDSDSESDLAMTNQPIAIEWLVGWLTCPSILTLRQWKWIVSIGLSMIVSSLTCILLLYYVFPILLHFTTTELYEFRIFFTTSTTFIASLCACLTPNWQYGMILYIESIVFTMLTIYSAVCPINQNTCDLVTEPSKVSSTTLALIFLFRWITTNNRFDALFAYSLDVLGFLYIIGTLSVIVAFVDDDKRILYRKLLIVLLYVTWASDTGAYVTGKVLSRIGYHNYHPLASHLSKNKDYEGTIGAIVCGIGAMTITSYLLQVDGSFSIKMVFTIIAVIVGRCGDLFASLLKRSARVKDSGRLIPGHGGCLDRIDALMFAAFVFSKYYMLVIA